MIALTTNGIEKLRQAAQEIGESSVTVATKSGVITFDFTTPHEISARVLGYECQPSREQLSAMFGIPLTAETA